MNQLTVLERRNKIIELLNETGKVNVNELSKHFGVSQVIIRADLSDLEKQDMLSRVHGGAITSYKAYYNMSLMQRSNINSCEKAAIAEKVCEIIKDNSTIMMNAGTTPIFILRALVAKKLTIVTNSIALALEGARNPNFKIILLGGDVDSDYQFTYGISVIKSLEQYTADFLVLSVDGVDAANGISTFYYQEVEICKQMIHRAEKTIIAADYSKIGRIAFANISKIKASDIIVTSANAADLALRRLKTKGLNVITV